MLLVRVKVSAHLGEKENVKDKAHLLQIHSFPVVIE